MTFEWTIDHYYQLSGDNQTKYIPCENLTSPCPDIAIYFDTNLLLNTDSHGVTSNTKPAPLFILNGTYWSSFHGSAMDRRANYPIFRTDVLLRDAGRTMQAYPFDKYVTNLSTFAEDMRHSNSSVGLVINHTSGIAAGFNTAKLTSSKTSGFHYTVVDNIEVTRGPVIRVYAIFIVITIWVVTLTFVIACVAAVFFGKGTRAEVLVLPIATLFAFTQLRGTLPGAPSGFGADIDFVGTLPCLALLTFCIIRLHDCGLHVP
ncbi:hypothetical protein OBBRIDRAFT_886342 [Obba rivulosa]|uniref:Uncharacterized protein n=1 Tax=Obba rivulosa TaxID=1052685 RepID=A0A8E2B4H8_9APHY|nr:hypothetical protein OBBRIDRAFT_886342 [Obba rivulosa]